MATREKDPEHWLYRLSVDEWLAAADNELQLCEAALARRAFRPGVTHARRAAGMAWNAVLVVNLEREKEMERYGRSYMEHVAALASDEGAPEQVRAAAGQLRDTPAAPPTLITLGKPDLAPLQAAQRVVAYARQRTAATN